MVMPRTTARDTVSAGGEETEEGRRPTLVSSPLAASPELVDRPRRRRTFTAADKVRILAEIDRGPSMKAKATALLLADLGVTKSHSRPYTSDDNPFSESCFKTLKYQPQFPKRLGSIQDAKTFCRAFFDWYNQHHRHLDIGLMTPDQVHYGQVAKVHAARQKTLDYAFRANPNRFVNKAPEPPQKPTAVWINPPAQELHAQA